MLPISTWDSHHFDQLGSNALCEEQTLTFITAIIIVDDVYYHLPLTPSAHLHMWCFRAAVGRRVCVHCCCCSSVAQRMRRSTAQNKHPCLPTILTPPSPTYRLTIYHIFFALVPRTQLSYHRPATRHSAGMTFLGSIQQYGVFRPWWRGLVKRSHAREMPLRCGAHTHAGMHLDKRSEPDYPCLFVR